MQSKPVKCTAHREDQPPVGNFSLSVAGYVVKAECPKFKQEEKCPDSS